MKTIVFEKLRTVCSTIKMLLMGQIKIRIKKYFVEVPWLRTTDIDEEVVCGSHIDLAQHHCWHLELCGRQRKYWCSDSLCSGCKRTPTAPLHCQCPHCRGRKESSYSVLVI